VKKLVVCDIDGTLVSYRDGDHPRSLDGLKLSDFIPKTVDFVRGLIDDGYKMCILTARVNEEAVLAFGEEYFGEAFLPDITECVSSLENAERFRHMKTRERKSIVLDEILDDWDNVVFIDDERPNLEWADALGKEGLKTVWVGDIGRDERLTETLHVKHIEDMIFDGPEAIDKVVYDLRHILTLLETGSSDVNASIKIDGSPVLTLYSSYPGLEGPGVMLQKFSSIEKAKPFRNEAEIDAEIQRKVAKGTDAERMGGLKSILTQALRLAALLPAGQLWQGEVLFGQKSDLKSYRDEESGDDWLYVKPSALMYCVPADSELATTLRASTFGIVFHTIYDESMRESFQIPVDEIGAPPEFFVMAAEEIQIPDGAKIPQETSQEISREIDSIESKLRGIVSRPEWDTISTVAKYRDFVLECAEEERDVSSDETYSMWADHRVKRFRSKPEKAKAEADELKAYVSENSDLIGEIISVIGDVVEIKKEYISAMSKFSKFSTKFDLFGKIRNTSPEGICVTDRDGSIVKLVDKQTFQKISYYLHGNTNIDLGALKERRLREKISGGKITFYTSSKSDDLIEHYLNKDLKFGLNQGLAGGFGSYAVLNNPLDGKVSSFGEEGRKNIYGDYVYQFSISDQRIFYLDYSLFEKSTLPGRMGLSTDSEKFITDQFNHFKIPVPKDTSRLIVGGDVTEAKAMKNFYNYMNSIYYQNEDGTIDSPIDGFIYNSKLDGETIVVWRPYKMSPMGVSKSGGPFKPMTADDPRYQRYMEEVNGQEYSEWVESESNRDRIFGGVHDSEKERVYRLLQDSNLDSDSFQMGTFSNVKINADKTIDATYKSNLPISDGFRHYMRMIDTPALDEIASMGYRFGRLDSGLKFGNKSGGGSYRMYHLRDAHDFKMFPREITGGIDLYYEDYDGTKLDIETDGTIRLDRAKVLTTKNLNNYDRVIIGKYVYATPEILEKMRDLGIEGLEDSRDESREAEDERVKAEKKSKKKVKENIVMNDLFQKILREETLSTDEAIDHEKAGTSIKKLISDKSFKNEFFLKNIKDPTSQSTTVTVLNSNGDVLSPKEFEDKMETVENKNKNDERKKVDINSKDYVPSTKVGGMAKDLKTNYNMVIRRTGSTGSPGSGGFKFEEELLDQMTRDKSNISVIPKGIFEPEEDYIFYDVVNLPISLKDLKVFGIVSDKNLCVGQMPWAGSIGNDNSPKVKTIERIMNLKDENSPFNFTLLRKSDLLMFNKSKLNFVPISCKSGGGNGGEPSFLNLLKFLSKTHNFKSKGTSQLDDLRSIFSNRSLSRGIILHSLNFILGYGSFIKATKNGDSVETHLYTIPKIEEERISNPTLILRENKNFEIISPNKVIPEIQQRIDSMNKDASARFSIFYKFDDILVSISDSKPFGPMSFKYGGDTTAKIQNKLMESSKPLLRKGHLFEKVFNEAGKNIYSKSFRDWFGEWEEDPENSSKCIGDDGKPLVLWHGGKFPEDVEVFHTSGADTGNSTGTGLWMADNPRVSEQFSSELSNGREEGVPSEGRRIKLYCNLRNPYIQDAKFHFWRSVEAGLYHIEKDGELVDEATNLGEAKEKARALIDELEVSSGEGKEKYVVRDGEREIYRGGNKSAMEKAIKEYIRPVRVKPPKDTDTIVREARATGKYDGVIITNINIDDENPRAYEEGNLTPEMVSTYVVAFDPKQVKAVDNETFDPQSERFREESEGDHMKSRLFEEIVREAKQSAGPTYYGFGDADDDLGFAVFSSKSRAMDNAYESGVEEIFSCKVNPSVKLLPIDDWIEEGNEEGVTLARDGGFDGYEDSDENDMGVYSPLMVLVNSGAHILKIGKAYPVEPSDEDEY
jgi:hypothetical protein